MAGEPAVDARLRRVTFPPGAEVVVVALGKTGRVVEAARGGRYRVRVGGLIVACREDELAAVGPGRKGKGRRRREPSPPAAGPVPSAGEARRLGSIDLHGKRVDEAVTLVEERIDLALRAGLAGIEVVHGIGTGRVMNAVHRCLKGIAAVKSFAIDPRNPGVTRVYF